MTWECLICGSYFRKPEGQIIPNCPNCNNKNVVFFQYIGENF